MSAPVPTRFEENVNAMSSYTLGSLTESAALGAGALYLGVLSPATAAVFAVTRFAAGVPISFAGDKLFGGAAANTASKILNLILQTTLPFLAALGVCYLAGMPIVFNASLQLAAGAVAIAVSSFFVQRAITIVELGWAQYFA